MTFRTSDRRFDFAAERAVVRGVDLDPRLLTVSKNKAGFLRRVRVASLPARPAGPRAEKVSLWQVRIPFHKNHDPLALTASGGATVDRKQKGDRGLLGGW